MKVTSCRPNLRLTVIASGCCRAPLLGRRDARRIIARNLSSSVRIIEVGPRDGLQNIKSKVPPSVKVDLVNRLAAAGLTDIEATSFVSPKWIPQLSDGEQVMDQIMPLTEQKPVRLSFLTPNLKGFERALAAGAKEMVVFASATEAFSK
ncbi:hydroxymethylglutaryl-CoA lyase [Cladophialophora psammophila CBS 110553]|uniref:hydroxymethylglutaryl-CoA lyase n=1 Tax=Cladophialophora psammophila CBS 110553 TaxID=1182543 RepID=W9XCN5_9EURO|nr:hydroxymethylglutaryl-CoA lyase [Cladophialophora psammophila CBS 110553]EXJ75080.1 hydroxymethylglutaryl-CoA lyase [Cladophialophora psammophila CBS 110553]